MFPHVKSKALGVLLLDRVVENFLNLNITMSLYLSII